MPPVPEQLSGTIETLYRSESGRVLATLVRLLGDLDLAEEAMHEAFAAALGLSGKDGSIVVSAGSMFVTAEALAHWQAFRRKERE